jgi:transposase InsO family protein
MRKTCGPVMRLQVTDLFFRSLAGLLHHRDALSESHACGCPHISTISFRCVDRTTTAGGHRLRRRAARTSFAIVIASLEPVRARVAATSGIEMLKTPYHAPRANAICERFLGSVRRECLDHVLILHEKQLHRVLNAYVQYAQPRSATSRHQAADSRAEI